ncbi:transposase [Mesorhizobium sp. M0991]|uniref:IS66-like element accessory protein TnpA n=1 Tax=Mesorhizobium sp. M0991 TaxID=2957043 RepID=UPI00333750CD
MRVEILGAERRRRWGDKKKLDIVMSVGIEGATVTEVAERHDVTRQQIYTWRRELRRKGLLLPSGGPMFLPVDMPVGQSEPRMGKGTDRLSASLVELQLCCGRNLRFDREIDLATLTRLIHAVEAA